MTGKLQWSNKKYDIMFITFWFKNIFNWIQGVTSSQNLIYVDVIPVLLSLYIITTNLSVKNVYCKFHMGAIKK